MISSERRAFYRTGLSTLYRPGYDALCAELPPEWAPYFGARTVPEQNSLYSKGRSTMGEPCQCSLKPCLKHPLGLTVTNAQGGESAHNYGCASDWTLWVDGKPVWMKGSDPRWQPYIDAIVKALLRSGSTFSSADYPHNELMIDCSWKHVAVTFSQRGMTAAQQHIEANLHRAA